MSPAAFVPRVNRRASWARAVFAGITIAAASLAFLACGDDAPPATPTATATPNDDWLPRYNGVPNQDDALLAGILGREGNCLVVKAQSANESTRVVVPAAVRWDGGRNVLTFEGKVYPFGEAIRFGGGFANDAPLDWVNEPDPACIADGYFIAGEPE